MPVVSIVIATRNRREEVLRAVESSLAQQGIPCEVLVYDDASTDGTAKAIRESFPEARLFSCQEQRGYLTWRNRGFHDARGAFVVSIDDDSYFTDDCTVALIASYFNQLPRAAALAIPYYEPFSERNHGYMPPRQPGTLLRSYVGCAHALRRQLALENGGYRELLAHQGEERDLCIRLINKKWNIVYADVPPLVHMCSSKRDQKRVDYYGHRNTLLFSSFNAPQPFVVPRMCIDTLQLLKHNFSASALRGKLKALASGWIASWHHRQERTPVSHMAYRRFRSLPGHGPLDLSGQELPQPVRRER